MLLLYSWGERLHDLLVPAKLLEAIYRFSDRMDRKGIFLNEGKKGLGPEFI